MVSFAGNPVLDEVADGSGVGLLSVDKEVIFSCVYDKVRVLVSMHKLSTTVTCNSYICIYSFFMLIMLLKNFSAE